MEINSEYTESEKVLIASAMYNIIYELEGAQSVLWAANEVYFNDDQKDIPAAAAETLGKLLRVYLGMMCGVIRQYKEIVGDF